MNKPTPGPWHTDPSKSFYVFADGALTEQAGVTHGPFICNASTAADARLIATAPELFDALLMALPFVEDHEGDTCYKAGAVAKAIERIRGVIEKAMGETL